MNFALKIIKLKGLKNSKQHPIYDLIRILGRGIQTDYMKHLLYCGMNYDKKVPDLDWELVGFGEQECVYLSNNKFIAFRDLKKEVKTSKKIKLSTDLILPWPWNRERLQTCISNIGEGREWGKWIQDYDNHSVEVWLPMGVAWVYGGNHSISIGIIQGGEIEPEHYYDISDVYKYVRCNGIDYRRINDDVIIAPVRNVDYAAIFEIGRLLRERNMSFSDQEV